MSNEQLAIHDSIRVRLRYPNNKMKIITWKDMPSNLLITLACKRYNKSLHYPMVKLFSKWL